MTVDRGARLATNGRVFSLILGFNRLFQTIRVPNQGTFRRFKNFN